MSCFTVNKFLGAVSAKSLLTPSSPRKSRKGAGGGAGGSSSKCPLSPQVRAEEDRGDDRRGGGDHARSPTKPRRHRSRTLCTEDEEEDRLSMKNKICDLTRKLSDLSSEKDFYESSFNRMRAEKLMLLQEHDVQLDHQSRRYEERLVELHSVIAELARQLEQKNNDQIKEEEEEDDEEEHEQEEGESLKCDDDATTTVSRVSGMDASRTSTDILDAQAVEAGHRLLEHFGSCCSSRGGSSNNLRLLSTVQEELAEAKQTNLELRARLSQTERDLSDAHAQLRRRNQRGKVAERRKIDRLKGEQDVGGGDEDDEEEDEEEPHRRKVQGSDFTVFGVRNGALAQYLCQDLQDRSSLEEFSRSVSSGSSSAMRDKMREFEIEMDRLASRMEHLKAQNQVLTLTLKEAKDHGDELTVLLGKYESNHTASQLSCTYAENTIECLEALIELLEADLGVPSDGNPGTVAEEQKKVAEQRGLLLLTRLGEEEARPDSGLAVTEENSSSNSESVIENCDESHAGNVEARLRRFIERMKLSHRSVQATMTEPEKWDKEDLQWQQQHDSLCAHEAKAADLETAVLLQELMAMREERSDLRAQVFILEREKRALELSVQTLAIPNSQDDHEAHDLTELVRALEKVKMGAEMRQRQQDEIIAELKMCNENLCESLERTRKRYQEKLKRLEQQILQTLMPKQFGERLDSNSQSIYSGVSTEDPALDAREVSP